METIVEHWLSSDGKIESESRGTSGSEAAQIAGTLGQLVQLSKKEK